ncbi:hypothetical protein [Shewanella zhangzhouensis]|uniref:hypothetical protein n=1 Tax=Shewanella zhangzhouensis TaxID=2864213 RepID=UPI001C658441|nr:hypothetical protein [Shewanella zhangzhouensis]QYK04954.1 hypothetical protein K0H63_18215 [Shewanella zhangzhouensis]
MMEFLEQTFKWLSLLGALHCLGLGLYLRYLYRSNSGHHRLLAGIFSLLSLTFFSGLLTRDTVSLPMPLIYSLFIPGYFLLMPLLYQYCRQALDKHSGRFWYHYLPAPLIAIGVAIDQLLRPGLMVSSGTEKVSLADYSPLATVLIVLLFIQTCFYFVLIFKLLLSHSSRGARAHEHSLQDIRFRWLMTLCLALMFNWLIRVVLTLIPIYFGDGVTSLMLMLPRMILLLSLYLLAFYGLQQITRAAYLRGQLSLPQKVSQKSSSQLLSADELNYLQTLLREEKK